MSAPVFTVVVLTSAPPGLSADAGGAFVKVDGRECLLRSVELFLNRDNVKQVLLVVAPERIEDAKARYGAHLSFSGVKVIAGGLRWMDQIIAAGAKITPESTHVVVHDAARPVVPFSDVDTLLESATRYDAVALATPVRATLVETDEGGSAMAYHLPNCFQQLLTPQVFSKATFTKMVESKQEVHASVLRLIDGSAMNMRVGQASDASLAKTCLGMLPKPKKNPLTNPFEEAQW